jgi:hypothetical protein
MAETTDTRRRTIMAKTPLDKPVILIWLCTVAILPAWVGALAEGPAQAVNPLATWEVTEDDSAPDGNHVLALSSPNHKSRRTYNLCWTDGISFGDGEIGVLFKANTGVIDQGGGIIWRAVDKDNHYVCRANPLEDNLWLYHTVDGRRVSIQRADVKMTSGDWHEVRVVHAGNHIRCFYDGKLLIEVDDDTFTEAGGVGLWTKADAATSFDVFRVEKAGGDR